MSLKNKIKERAWNIFVAISILLASIIYGTNRITLSANMGKPGQNRVEKIVCSILDVVLNDPDHCRKEYEDDFGSEN